MPREPLPSQIIAELLALAASGDKQAQERLLRSYRDLIQAAVAGRLYRLNGQGRWGEEADDMVQEVAIEVLQALPRHTFRSSAAFVAWIKSICKTVLTDRSRYHRAAKRNPAKQTSSDNKPLADVPPRSAESWLDHHQQLARLQHNIGQLKPTYRAALLMHHGGYTHQEIGHTLDCSAESARKLVSRAMSKLVGMVEPDLERDP